MNMDAEMEVIGKDEAGVTVRQEFGGSEVTRRAETAMAAMQAQQQAMVQARFVMALQRRRNWEDVRLRILNLCKSTSFAEEALYVKPVARTPEEWQGWTKQERLRNAPADWPRGFSIRFVEAALFEAGNFDCPTMVIWEDDNKRLTLVAVTDLERNSSYSRTITTPKTIERRKLKYGQTAIAIRENAAGDMLYVVRATDDEVATKEAASVSKVIRTLGEKLLPPHHKAEWRRQIEATIADKAVRDPEEAKKEILDAFFKIGIQPSEIERYLGHGVAALTPTEYVEMRGVYVAVAAGEATWSDAMQAKHGDAPAEEKVEEPPRQKAIKARIEAQRKKASASPPSMRAPEEPPEKSEPAAEYPD
jgi:hypothetical protein